MNKKVLTLCVSALLAGGMFGTANASEWTSDTQYVLNTGKYHLLHQVAVYNGSWSAATGAYLNYYLSAEEDGTPIFSTVKDKNAYWTISTRVVAGVTYYQFKNAEGNTLVYTHNAGTPTEKKIDWFIVESTSTPLTFNDLSFMDGSTQYYLNAGTSINATDYTVVANVASAGVRGFDNVEIAEEVISARDLNAVLKDGFGLVIGSAKDKEYTSLQGNVFTGEIEAKNGATAGTYYFYRKADKKYIVLSEDVWSENTANLDGKERSAYAGYKFEAISEHAFGLMSAAEKVAQAEFQVLKSYDFNDTDSLIVTLPNAQVGEMPATWTGDATSVNANQDKGVRLFVSTVDNKDYLTVIEYAKANDRLALQHDDAYSSYQVGASAPYIKLGLSNIVDFSKFADKVWNITRTDGTVLAPNVDWSSADAFEDEFDNVVQNLKIDN